MKINPPGLIPILLLASVLLSALSVPAKAEVTFAEALDAPGLKWTQSGNGRWVVKTGPLAYDETDYVEVEGSRTENGMEYVSATLTAEVTGPAVVRFWWQYVSTDTDPALGVVVDGAVLEVPAWALGTDGWTQLEIQLSPGPHTFGFRPFWGMVARLDAFSVTPGTGLFSQFNSSAPLCWLTTHHGGIWTAGAGAPPRVSGSAVWYGFGNIAWAACVLPPEHKLEGWLKSTLDGCSISTNLFFDSTLYREPSPDWRRVRMVPASRWISFVSYSGDENHVDLHLAGVTAVPAGVGDVLDAPELTWAASGVPPLQPVAFEAAPFGTGGLFAQTETSFDTGVSTSLTGPGRLFFSSDGYRHNNVFWRVRTQHETVTGSFPGGYWQRKSVSIPAGPATAEISVVSEGNFGHAYLDDVTWCVAAKPDQKDALDMPEAAEMWVRQSAADLWTRTTAASHTGGDALSLAPSVTARRADLVIPVAGTRLAGMWVRARPQFDLVVTRTSPVADSRVFVERFQPVTGNDWTWTPFSTGPDAAELRITVPPDSDDGQELYFDGYQSYVTPVPVAEALDTTGITWSGSAGLALPGSSAIGEKAVVLTSDDDRYTSISMMPGGPFRMKYRYRFTDPSIYRQSLFSLNASSDGGGIPAPAESYSDPSGWREEEIICYSVSPDATLTVRNARGVLLLDKVEFHPMANVTFAAALDAPGITPFSPEGWRGIAGIGHDGMDALVSPARTVVQGVDSWEMHINTPFAGSAVNGGFWWKNELPSGLMFKQINAYAGNYLYSGTGWQQIRFHFDRMAPQLSWTQQAASAIWLPVRDGMAMIDELTLNASPPDAFGRALETDINPSGPLIADTGWNAVGSAAVSVQTAVTWRDGDALEILPVPGGPPLQETQITAHIAGGTDFSCRVKRGPHPGSTLTIMLGDRSYAWVPLTTEWTEFRVLLPLDFSRWRDQFTFLATVPDAGPDAVIYLDDVSLVPATDLNAALETTGLVWTSTGDGTAVIGRETIAGNDLRIPSYQGDVDGVNFQGLTHGQQRRLDTVVTGPGTVVFTGYLPGNWGWRAGLMVDGITKDSLPFVKLEAFYLQAFIPAGPHAVRWFVERNRVNSAQPADIQLHSVAFVPGDPADLLPAALETLTPGRAWSPGGSHPPVPLYLLQEGVPEVHGLHFPVTFLGETSSVETSVTGPATVSFIWQSNVTAACYLDGLTAARTIKDEEVVRDSLHVLQIPPGTHTLRWASAQGVPAKLRAFSTMDGSEIAEILAGSSPPVVWLHHHHPYDWDTHHWRVRTDETLTLQGEDGSLLEVPGTGLPVLAGSDTTSGSFWVHGPAVVSYDFRRRDDTVLSVDIDDGPDRYSGGPLDLQWHPDAIVVPTGDHLVSFSLPPGGVTLPNVWLKNIRIQTGLPWITWAYGIGLVEVTDSSPFDDPDGDGVINLMEFAFGTPPRAWNSPAGPQLTGTPESPRLQFPSLPWDATSLTYDVESSADLNSWSSFTTLHPNPPGHPGPSVSLPSPQEGRKFYRVTVRL